MILKIKGEGDKWVFYDRLDKVVNNGIHAWKNGRFWNVNYKEGEPVIDEDSGPVGEPEIEHIFNQEQVNDCESQCILLEFQRYSPDDESAWSRTAAVQLAYLLNDSGQTIEKIS